MKVEKLLPVASYREQFSQINFVLKKILGLLWRINPRLIVVIFVLSGLWGLLIVPGFYLEKLILDEIVDNIGNPAWQRVLWGLSVLVVIRIGLETTRNLLSRVMGLLQQHASRVFSAKLEAIIARKAATLDAKTLEDPGFQDRFNKVERESTRRAWNMIMPLSNMPNYGVGLISTLGVLWWLHPLVVVGLVVVAVPSIFVDRKFIKAQYKMDEEVATDYRIWGWLIYFMSHARSILETKLLKLQDYFAKRVDKIQSEILSRRFELNKRREKNKTATLVVSQIYYVGVNVFLLARVLAGKITIGSYELFLRSLLSASSNFHGLANALLNIYENYLYVAELSWFLELKPQLVDGEKKMTGSIAEEIKFEDVWFKYKKESKWVLRGVGLTIKPGERIAIVGENGQGKTTFIKLLARYYDPQKGVVKIDGDDIREFAVESYQSKFGILFQHFQTYPFSAQESIGYGDASRLNLLEEIREQASKTDIDDYIMDLPRKYKNPLDPAFPKGIEPSIGQWQRIGIARMLFRKGAEILVLDEPTSNIDPKAEEKIFNRLVELSENKILIFVSQRFSTVRRADRILVFHRGRIVEQGSHEELMKKQGRYAKMFELQAKGYR